MFLSHDINSGDSLISGLVSSQDLKKHTSWWLAATVIMPCNVRTEILTKKKFHLC